MKYLGIVVVMLAIVGCSNTPSKLERIEANEQSIVDLQSAVTKQQEAILDIQTTPENTDCPASCVIQIDRAFEKSQYK